jgi:hypothetical protein
MTESRTVRCGLAAVALAAVGTMTGCGRSDRRDVAGRVAAPANVDLTGNLVEIASPDDPNVRGSGVIEPGGRFRLESLADGQRQPGVKEGRYQARLILADEGDGRAAKPPVPRKYLDFKTSGWAVDVPAAGEVVLTVTAK